MFAERLIMGSRCGGWNSGDAAAAATTTPSALTGSLMLRERKAQQNRQNTHDKCAVSSLGASQNPLNGVIQHRPCGSLFQAGNARSVCKSEMPNDNKLSYLFVV